MKIKLYWHLHHGILLESLTEPFKNRVKYIKENKPKDEIALRLRLMKPVKGKLPTELVKAYQVWNKTYQAWEKADQAREKMLKKHTKTIEALHRKECPNCPWNGKTIFPK